MEAKDLMIGDCVMQDDNLQHNRTCQITGIYDNVVVDVTGEKVPLHESHIQPILLTPEILEKNGFRIIFEGELHTTYFQDIDGFAVEIKIDCIDFTKLSMSNGLGYRVATECKYVHQLQHALRLCGIKKEIVL